MLLVPPAQPSALRSLLAGAVAGGIAAVLSVPAQWAWRGSEGRIPSSSLFALALVVAGPLVERAARAIAGEAGPRLVWQGSAALVPVFIYAVVEGFFKACGSSPFFAIGSLAGDGVEPEILLGFAAAWTGGTGVAWIVDRLRRAWAGLHVPSAISRALPWLAVFGSVVLIVDASLAARTAPTAERYLASLEHIGTVPAVTLPTTPPSRPERDPTNAEAYPYRIPAAPDFGFHITRFCSDSACFVYFARAPFPEEYVTERFPKPNLDVYVPGGAAIDVWRDGKRGRLAFRVGRDVRRWFDESTLMGIFSAKELAGFLATPRAMIGTAGLGVALALGIAFVRGRRRRDLDLPWRPARLENGFIRFDDGTPPAPAPTSIASEDGPRDLLVVIAAAEARGSAFRDAHARTVERAFVGSSIELEALREERRAARSAAAFAAAIITAAPLLAAVGNHARVVTTRVRERLKRVVASTARGLGPRWPSRRRR